MDEAGRKKMEEQLGLWALSIDKLVARTQMAGVQAGFETHTHIDELKALHAIAQAKFDEFGAAEAPERARLAAGMKRAWRELGAAFRNPKPAP